MRDIRLWKVYINLGATKIHCAKLNVVNYTREFAAKKDAPPVCPPLFPTVIFGSWLALTNWFVCPESWCVIYLFIGFPGFQISELLNWIVGNLDKCWDAKITRLFLTEFPLIKGVFRQVKQNLWCNELWRFFFLSLWEWPLFSHLIYNVSDNVKKGDVRKKITYKRKKL